MSDPKPTLWHRVHWLALVLAVSSIVMLGVLASLISATGGDDY